MCQKKKYQIRCFRFSFKVDMVVRGKKGFLFFDLQNIKRPYSSKPRTDLDNKKETRGTDGDIHRIFFLLSQQVGMMST